MRFDRRLAFVFVSSALTLVPFISYADPVGVLVDVQCPIVSSTSSTLANYGDYVAGYGMESVSNQMFPVYFKSGTVQGVGADLTLYYNSQVNYNSITGAVTCSYSSYESSQPGFDVSYTITNGKGASVDSQSNNNDIKLVIPFGLK